MQTLVFSLFYFQSSPKKINRTASSSTFVHPALKLNDLADIVLYCSQCNWWQSPWRHCCRIHNGADGHLDRLQRLVLWLSSLRAVICSDSAGSVCAESCRFRLNDFACFLLLILWQKQAFTNENIIRLILDIPKLIQRQSVRLNKTKDKRDKLIKKICSQFPPF